MRAIFAERPKPTPHLRIARRLKNHRHLPIAARRTHQSPFQPSQWEVRAARGNQCLEVQLLAVDAAPHRPRFLPIGVVAAHVDLPAQAPGHAYRLDFHENKCGTNGRVGQASGGATSDL
jgi:hypothetical protein